MLCALAEALFDRLPGTYSPELSIIRQPHAIEVNRGFAAPSQLIKLGCRRVLFQCPCRSARG